MLVSKTIRDQLAQRTQHLWYLYNEGLNFDARSITISGQIGDGWFDRIDAGLGALEADSLEHPITLRLCSCGGEVYEAMAVLGRIRASPCKVDVQVFGECMSAATVLLAGASGKRSISEFAWFMWHTGWVQPPEDMIPRVMDFAKQQMREDKQWVDVMAKFTKQPAKYWMKAIKERRDDYLTPSQAVAVGVADEVF